MCKKQNISHRNGQVLNSVGNLNHLKFRCQSGMEENHWYNKPAEWITSLQCILHILGDMFQTERSGFTSESGSKKAKIKPFELLPRPRPSQYMRNFFELGFCTGHLLSPLGYFGLSYMSFGCCNVPKIQVNWARFPVQSTPTGKKSGQTSLVPPDCIDKLITLHIHIVYHPHLWIWGWGTHGPTFFGAFLVNTIPMKIIK